ncbi:Retrotransposon-derived protein peg10 [Sorochytrium milnesiophthora]
MTTITPADIARLLVGPVEDIDTVARTFAVDPSATSVSAEAVVNFFEVIAQLRRQVATLQAAAPPSSSAAPHRHRVPPPQPYGGGQRELQNFLFAFDMFLNLDANSFPADSDNFAYMVASLQGDVATWARGLYERTPEIYHDYAGFVRELSRSWGNPDKHLHANQITSTMKHRRGDNVIEYVNAFRNRTDGSTYNVPALVDMCRKSLDITIIEAMTKTPTNWEDLVHDLNNVVRILAERQEARRHYNNQHYRGNSQHRGNYYNNRASNAHSEAPRTSYVQPPRQQQQHRGNNHYNNNSAVPRQTQHSAGTSSSSAAPPPRHNPGKPSSAAMDVDNVEMPRDRRGRQIKAITEDRCKFCLEHGHYIAQCKRRMLQEAKDYASELTWMLNQGRFSRSAAAKKAAELRQVLRNIDQLKRNLGIPLDDNKPPKKHSADDFGDYPESHQHHAIDNEAQDYSAVHYNYPEDNKRRYTEADYAQSHYADDNSRHSEVDDTSNNSDKPRFCSEDDIDFGGTDDDIPF